MKLCARSSAASGTHTWLPRPFCASSFYDILAQKEFIRRHIIIEPKSESVYQQIESMPQEYGQSLDSEVDSDLVYDFDMDHDFNNDLLNTETLQDPALEPESAVFDIDAPVQKIKKPGFFSWFRNSFLGYKIKEGKLIGEQQEQKEQEAVATLLQEQTKYIDAMLQEQNERVQALLEENNAFKKQKKYNTSCDGFSVTHQWDIAFFTEYQQNFGNECRNSSHSLGAMPFWSGTNTMTYGNNDGQADLDAYQFGLGNIKTDANGIGGIIELNPKIQQITADALFYYARRQYNHGMFFKVHIPFGALIVHPNFKEIPTAMPDNLVSFRQETLPPGSSEITYQFTEYPTPFDRPQSLAEAFFGGDPAMDRLKGNRPHPVRIRRGRIPSIRRVEIRLADLSTSLGYNYYFKKGFVGVGVKATFPTGNVPTADFLIDPICGRGGAWGFGGEFSGSVLCWQHSTQEKSLSVAWQGQVLHLFTGRTPNMRSFDLKRNGPGSKYLLVQNYRAHYERINNNKTIATLANFDIQPAVNITTLPALSKIAVEGCLGLMFSYLQNNWNVSFGAEFWGRSKEKLAIDVRSAVDMRLPNLNDYAVLGRQVSDYLIDGQPVVQFPNPGLLTRFYCEPLARIGKSEDTAKLVGSIPNVHAPDELPPGIKDARLPENRIPEKLEDALDLCGAAATQALSVKLLGQIGYSWTQRCYQPSLSVIGSFQTDQHRKIHINFWSLGLAGTLNF